MRRMLLAHYRIQRGTINFLIVGVSLYLLATAVHVPLTLHAWSLINSPFCTTGPAGNSCGWAVNYFEGSTRDPLARSVRLSTFLPCFIVMASSGVLLGVSAIARERDRLHTRVVWNLAQTRQEWFLRTTRFNLACIVLLGVVMSLLQYFNVYAGVHIVGGIKTEGPSWHLATRELFLYALLPTAIGVTTFLLSAAIGLMTKNSIIVVVATLILVAMAYPLARLVRESVGPVQSVAINQVAISNVNDQPDDGAAYLWQNGLTESYEIDTFWTYVSEMGPLSGSAASLVSTTARSCVAHQPVVNDSGTFLTACLRKAHIHEVVRYVLPSDFAWWQCISLGELGALQLALFGVSIYLVRRIKG